MKHKLKKIGLHLLYPHPLLILLFTAISTVLLIITFMRDRSEHPVAYVTYVFSFYSLSVACIRIPTLIRFFKNFKNNNKYLHRYSNDATLRIKISLYGNFAYNAAYAIFQLCLGIWHSSTWYFAFAAYYFLLAIMRLFLLRDVHSTAPDQGMRAQWSRYRFCGIMLVVMNLALSAIVWMISVQGHEVVHHQITTITMAASTFTLMTLAIINVVKYSKFKSPLFSAAKVISLATSAVSMLTLENSMLAAFGAEGDTEFKPLMTLLTGLAVTAFVLGLGIYMIIRASKRIKKIKITENQRESE
ncbi:MAG: hypothetical protein IJW70_03030 [Clostridia bacterium]|nr:hypothetical protein [Clostridia bacterium]